MEIAERSDQQLDFVFFFHTLFQGIQNIDDLTWVLKFQII